MAGISSRQNRRLHWKVETAIYLVVAWGVIYFFADHHDIFRRITAKADQDIITLYNALLFNEGLPQQYFDHTGYIYFLIYSSWIKILHLLGVVTISSLSDLSYSQESYNDLELLIFAGRYLTIFLACIITTIFFFGLKRITGNLFVSGVISILFAVSPGISEQAIQMRTELTRILRTR